MKKLLIAVMTGAFAFSLVVGCSSQGDSKADTPTSGGMVKPAEPTSGTPMNNDQKSGTVDPSSKGDTGQPSGDKTSGDSSTDMKSSNTTSGDRNNSDVKSSDSTSGDINSSEVKSSDTTSGESSHSTGTSSSDSNLGTTNKK